MWLIKFKMKIKVSHIARYLALAVLLHLLLALAPAMAQNVVRQGETSNLAVQPQPGDTYMWTMYNDSTVNFAVTPGTVSDTYFEFTSDTNSSTVTVLWKKPGIYFFKVNASNITGCTNNLKIGKMRVLEALPTATLTSTTICVGETATLTIEFTGTAPWSFTITDGTTTETVTGVTSSPYGWPVQPKPKVTTEYTITQVKDTWGTNNYPANPPKVLQEVKPKPVISPIYRYGP